MSDSTVNTINTINYKNFRIKFEKTKTAKYISHLDVSRMFSRAVARAGIKIAHSEGFNPHPKIVFASGLSLGIESFCELVDIKVIETNNIAVTETEIHERLKNVFPPGINIKEVYAPESKFKDIDRTRFHIFVSITKFIKSEKYATPDELHRLFENDVIVEKKPGVNINLKDYICDITVLDNLSMSDTANISGGSREYKLIDAVLKTNQEMFLNPENIIKVINSTYSVGDYIVQKIQTYDKNFNIFM